MKLKFSPYLLLFSFIMLSSVMVSQTLLKDPSGFKKQLSAASQKINSIESSFIQEKNLTMLLETIITKGKFYYKKEDKLRWEYTEPFKYLFILNNGKAFIKDDAKQNKFDIQSNKTFSEVNAILMGSAQGTILNDEKRFSSTYFENSDAYIVKLKPRSSKLASYLNEIVIIFDKNDVSVTKLEMHEPSGDFTKIEFIRKQTNTLLNDEKFIIP